MNNETPDPIKDPRKRRPSGTILHVDRHVIAANRKHSQANPPLTVKYGSKGFKGSALIIKNPNGKEIGRLVYRPESPISCGATVWLEVEPSHEVECFATEPPAVNPTHRISAKPSCQTHQLTHPPFDPSMPTSCSLKKPEVHGCDSSLTADQPLV